MEGPFTESRKITLNSYIVEENATRLLVNMNGKSENNETYELELKGLNQENPKDVEVTFVLNRDGVELWKVEWHYRKNDELSTQISLQLFCHGTVYKANWMLESNGDAPITLVNIKKILFELTNDHKFLEFGFNNHAQSGNFNLKSNFIAEVIDSLFHN